MRIPTIATVVLALGLALAGCGKEPAPGDGGSNGIPATSAAAGSASGIRIDLDKLDPCQLLTPADVQAFFGEAPGNTSPTGSVDLTGCNFDNRSGTAYLSLLVQEPPFGAKQQFDYDRTQDSHVTAVPGLGEAAYTSYRTDEADLEILHANVVLHLSRQAYGLHYTLDHPTDVAAKLVPLGTAALSRLP